MNSLARWVPRNCVGLEEARGVTQDRPSRAERRRRRVPTPAAPVQRLAQPGEQVKGHYIKSPQARVIHVDGAFGGPTNSLLLHLAVFSEHRVPGDEVIITQEARGQLRETTPQKEDAVSFVREIEADLMMTPAVARAIHVWLGERLGEIDDAARQIQAARDAENK